MSLVNGVRVFSPVSLYEAVITCTQVQVHVRMPWSTAEGRGQSGVLAVTSVGPCYMAMHAGLSGDCCPHSPEAIGTLESGLQLLCVTWVPGMWTLLLTLAWAHSTH